VSKWWAYSRGAKVEDVVEIPLFDSDGGDAVLSPFSELVTVSPGLPVAAAASVSFPASCTPTVSDSASATFPCASSSSAATARKSRLSLLLVSVSESVLGGGGAGGGSWWSCVGGWTAVPWR